MDSWSEKQLKVMSLGGNKAINEFMTTYDLTNDSI